MIKEDLFKKSINILQNYYEYETSLADLGINISEREEVANLINSYLELIQYCCKDTPAEDDIIDTSNIDHFIFDAEFGKKADKCYVVDSRGVQIHLYDVDTLWDILKSNNPDIVDIF